MTLYEILELTKDREEVTVWDRDYDIEVYFTYSEKNNDDWDMSMMKLAKALTVTAIQGGGYVCNIADVIEKHIGEPDFDEMFIDTDIDAIMDDIESVLAGNVSEPWLKRFADIIGR